MNIKVKIILFLSLLLLSSNYINSQENRITRDNTVTARLDSVNLMMGKVMNLYLEVVQNKEEKGYFPQLQKNADSNQSYIGFCGDSVELSTKIIQDTVSLGGNRIQINYTIPVQAFDSGTYRLPEFVYVTGNDSSFSNHVTFNVIPVNVTADDEIAGYANVAEPEGKKFYDFVPDWILDFWWIFILITLAIIASLWAVARYKKKGTFLPSKPLPTPNEKAMAALIALKEKKLWENGFEKEYFTELTDILRTYLFERFGINAIEMTSSQIIDRLSHTDVKDKKDYVQKILNIADFVKFAKMRPLPADSIESYNNALRFVEETAPVVVENNDDVSLEEAEINNPDDKPATEGGDKI